MLYKRNVTQLQTLNKKLREKKFRIPIGIHMSVCYQKHFFFVPEELFFSPSSAIIDFNY